MKGHGASRGAVSESDNHAGDDEDFDGDMEAEEDREGARTRTRTRIPAESEIAELAATVSSPAANLSFCSATFNNSHPG